MVKLNKSGRKFFSRFCAENFAPISLVTIEIGLTTISKLVTKKISETKKNEKRKKKEKEKKKKEKEKKKEKKTTNVTRVSLWSASSGTV